MQKTIEQMEDELRSLVILLLKLPKNAGKSVRFPYGSSVETGDAPAFSRTSNVCFIYVLPAGDDYGRLSNISYCSSGGDKLTMVDEHTNVWQINFVCYGSAACQWTRTIKDGLVRTEIRDMLIRSQLALVSGSTAITRVPEVKDGEWWNRYDLAATFYEAVRLEQENSVGVIESVHVAPVTEKGSD